MVTPQAQSIFKMITILKNSFIQKIMSKDFNLAQHLKFNYCIKRKIFVKFTGRHSNFVHYDNIIFFKRLKFSNY